MRNAIRLIGLAALVAASVSCGDVVRQGSSPVYLVINSLKGIKGGITAGQPSDFLESDVITNVLTPAPPCPCLTFFDDSGQVTLSTPLKDTGATAALSPTTNNQVTINRFHVEYIRADGRNTPGVDVPYPFDGAVTGTIAGGPLTLNFNLVRGSAKQEGPLVQLRSSSTMLTVIAKVTFYGADRVGNAVSATGQIQINFANFGDS